MNKYENYIQDFIKDELPNYENQFVYKDEIAGLITEGICADRSATYSRQAAVEAIAEWGVDAGLFLDIAEQEWGMELNPLLEPEWFQVRMIDYGVNEVMSKCKFLQEFHDEQVALTKDVIAQIVSSCEKEKVGLDYK